MRKVDAGALQTRLLEWLSGQVERGHHLALDGKTLCGSSTQKSEQLPLLSVFCTRSGLVIKDTEMQVGENEITAALRLLQDTPLKNKVITGDAIFAQKKCVVSSAKGVGITS